MVVCWRQCAAVYRWTGSGNLNPVCLAYAWWGREALFAPFCVFVCTCLVTKADSQLVEWYSVRTVSSEEHLELDGLVYVETGRAELSLALYCSQTERGRLEMCNAALLTLTFALDDHVITNWTVCSPALLWPTHSIQLKPCGRSTVIWLCWQKTDHTLAPHQEPHSDAGIIERQRQECGLEAQSDNLTSRTNMTQFVI